MNLSGKHVLVGITASIAAYKSATLVRLLVKSGAHVKVVMTPDSLHFIGALTLATLSKNPVYSQYFNPDTGEWSNHVELGKWADLFIIAPATSNTIAKMANGQCDNLLLATYLSSDCPVFIAPAMDLDMYQHPAFKHNLKQLTAFGNHIINSATGDLASGLSGEGRMEEPEEIINILERFQLAKPFLGKSILITAGPTYEAIDPVRFIGNHSSGKMGFAIAECAAEMGANVTLVSGPVNMNTPKGVNRIDVTSANEMHMAVFKHLKSYDIAICAAAVADYRPESIANQKIKKSATTHQLSLIKNKDILHDLGKVKLAHQFLVGFALETENEIANAEAKLVKKNLDLIVLNSLNDKGAGFGADTNKVRLIAGDNKIEELPLSSKKDIAEQLLIFIANSIQS